MDWKGEEFNQLHMDSRPSWAEDCFLFCCQGSVSSKEAADIAGKGKGPAILRARTRGYPGLVLLKDNPQAHPLAL